MAANKNETDQQIIDRQSDELNAQQERIDGLNAQIAANRFDLPMLKLSSQILLVPLVGAIDSVKAQTIMRDVLENIRANETRVAVIDIAGIKVVDSSVAANLIQIAMAANLMGCQAIISGISPQIATNIINLGVDVGDIITTNTLEDAILRAYETMNLELKPKV